MRDQDLVVAKTRISVRSRQERTPTCGSEETRAVIISEIEKVEIVFKDGVGYNSEQLIQSVQVVRGNPGLNISEIEKVEVVFMHGVGYDSDKLIQSVQGLVGIR